MTPDEINIAVAKRLGYEICHGPCFDPHFGEKKTHIFPPGDYCRNIKAAFEMVPVVESMPADRKGHCHWVFELQYGPLNNWHCRFHNNTSWDDGYRQEAQGEADTAAMAIALAFLELPT